MSHCIFKSLHFVQTQNSKIGKTPQKSGSWFPDKDPLFLGQNGFSETCVHIAPLLSPQSSAVSSMAVGVVEFSREGYKIRKDFA